MRGQIGPIARIAMVVMALAVCGAVTLAGCSDSGDSGDSGDSAEPAEPVDMEVPGETETPAEVPGEAEAPGQAESPGAVAVVVLGPGDWEPPVPTEADILAHRILSSQDDSLLLDPAERDRLADELAAVLSSIRDAHPAVADITARPSHTVGLLLVGLEPGLFDVVSSLLEEQAGPVELRTGYEAFDSLNATLGLSVVVDLIDSFHYAVFYFSEHLNVPAAAAAYAVVEGIEYAEPDGYVGDGPDIYADYSQGRWYIVARHAEGDCPSGCIIEELFYFVVDGTAVEMIDSEQAKETAEFMDLVMNQGR